MANELTKDDDTAVDKDTDHYLRAAQTVDALNAILPKRLPEIPKDYIFRKRDRKDVAIAFHAAFELCGGVPALIKFAHDKPEKFYGLYQRFAFADIDTNAGNTFVFNTPIPQNPLDLVSVNARGQVIEVGADDDLEV